ncbi:MAG: AAA family ATPase [bacterium]
MKTKKPYSILNIGANIWVFVITGGPCAGKTSALSWLSRELSDRGYKVLVSPESATKLIMSGILPGKDGMETMAFQECILMDTLAQEQIILSAAVHYRDAGHKVVVLCDRGSMDGKAYCTPSEFETMLNQLGFTERELTDGRYHAVMHLRTAALGAESFYTLANNVARSEPIEQARTIDQNTLMAWMGHSHPRIVDNGTDFDGKLRRLLVEVCAVLGDPLPIEIESKFLVERPDLLTFPVSFTESYIVQDYLLSNGKEERRVRARTSGGGTTYYYTVKREIGVGVRVEEEKTITEREYKVLLTLRDQTLQTIQKRRICFFWREQFFELDIFESPNSKLTLMEVERTDRSNEQIDIPPFITVIRNVTAEKQYSNRMISEQS